MNFCVKNEEKCSHKAENKLHSLIYDRFRVMANEWCITVERGP